MPFCPQCGASADGPFCPQCGAILPPAPKPEELSGLPENLASALCYLLGFVTGIAFLVWQPYAKNPRIRFHACQSIFLSLTWFFLLWFAALFVELLPDFFGAMFLPILYIVRIGGVLTWIYMLVKTHQGERVVLPYIGPLAETQANKT
jgi:uncharacterized membrane protein